jgi:hypothetical protein
LSATFSVYINGTTPTNQWQASYDGGSTWTNIPSATSSNYTKSGLVLADDQSKYRCIANVACNSSSATSSVATLTVIACTTASVTTSPTNITIGGGSTATFTVVAGGAQPTYQWQVSADNGATFTNVTTGTGATTASYTTAATTFGANQSNQFRAIISVACNSSSATSAPALLTLVCNAASVTTSPSSQTVLASSNVMFTVAFSGTAPTNQWQISTDAGATWSDLSNQTNSTYTRATVSGDNGYQFRSFARVNCDGSYATSSIATLTVAAPGASSFRSAATGNWNANATWELSTDNRATWVAAPGTPTFDNSTNILVRSGHTVSATAAVTVDDLTVTNGGILQANGGLITITNLGAPTDVYGSLRIANAANSALSTNATVSYLRFQNGGSFVWNLQATATVPLATWNDGSSCVFSNSATGTADMSGFSGQNFYDVTLVGISASARPRFNITNATVIRHDLTCILPDFAGSTMAWMSGTAALLTVSNNINITTGITANSTKVLINGSAATTSTVQVGGNININGNIDGFGGSTLLWEFNKIGAQSYSLLDVTNLLTPNVMTYQVDNGSTLTLLQDVTNAAAVNVLNGGTLATGTKVVTGTAFTLNSGATLDLGSSAGITASGATGNIQTGTRTFNTAANYIYSGSAAQVLGSGLPSTVNNLTLATGMTNSVSVTNAVANSTPFYTVSGTLTANSAKIAYTVPGTQLQYGTYNLFSYGTLSGSFNATLTKVSGTTKASVDLAQAGGFISLVNSNHAPVAVANSYSRAGGLTLKVKKADLVANDTDVDLDTVTFSSVSGTTTNGTTLTSDATYIFVPANTVADAFTYTISDGNGGTASGTVTIAIGSASGQTTASINTTGGSASLTFYGIPGYSYTIQVSTDLTNWTDVTTTTAGATGVITYTDNSPPTPAAFYRARYNP